MIKLLIFLKKKLKLVEENRLVTKLNLSNKKITDKQLEELSEMLKKHFYIKELCLDKNNITNIGLSYILKNITTLTCLLINDNQITLTYELINLFKTNRVFEEIYVSGEHLRLCDFLNATIFLRNKKYNNIRKKFLILKEKLSCTTEKLEDKSVNELYQTIKRNHRRMRATGF